MTVFSQQLTQFKDTEKYIIIGQNFLFKANELIHVTTFLKSGFKI